MTGLGQVSARRRRSAFGGDRVRRSASARRGPRRSGAWKKCYAQSKAAPFILITFIGAPLSQTIYGMILMNNLIKAAVSRRRRTGRG